MTSGQIAALWRRGQRGWPARFVIVQLPNPPLILGLSGRALAARTHGRTARYAGAAGRFGLAVFALLEVIAGANWLRRLVGVAVLGSLLSIATRRRGRVRRSHG